MAQTANGEDSVISTIGKLTSKYDAFEIIQPERHAAEPIPQPSNNPQDIFLFGEKISNYIRIKPNYFATFDPSKYPIVHLGDTSSVNQPQTDLYNRFSKLIRKEKFSKLDEGYMISGHGLDLIEGFLFNPEDKVIAISIHFNDLSIVYKVEDNKFLPKNFLVPIILMPYMNAFVRIITANNDNTKIDFRIIGGNFLYLTTIRDQQVDWKYTFEHLGKKYVILAHKDVGWILQEKNVS